MGDFESFQNALDQNKSSYMNDLTRSLSLVLDTFYENLNNVSVSSKTGEGFDKVIIFLFFNVFFRLLKLFASVEENIMIFINLWQNN